MKRKRPIRIALSNRILQKIDQEATMQKRSRSEWVELRFENLLFKLLVTEKHDYNKKLLESGFRTKLALGKPQTKNLPVNLVLTSNALN